MIAMYPGSFDPPTRGHQSVVEAALRLCDHLMIVVAVNRKKTPCYDAAKRQAMLEALYADDPRITVAVHEGLVVDFAAKHAVALLVRGLRQEADFADEYSMAMANAAMMPALQTVFVPASSSNGIYCIFLGA